MEKEAHEDMSEELKMAWLRLTGDSSIRQGKRDGEGEVEQWGTDMAAMRRGRRKMEARRRRTLKWMPPSQSASAAVVRSGE